MEGRGRGGRRDGERKERKRERERKKVKKQRDRKEDSKCVSVSRCKDTCVGDIDVINTPL